MTSRMEIDYHDLNVREYEDDQARQPAPGPPMSLIQLRHRHPYADLPEELFDFDGPGHYFRRIKSVAVSIPCIAGPYTGVNCTLSLQNSSIRSSPQIKAPAILIFTEPGYVPRHDPDNRY